MFILLRIDDHFKYKHSVLSKEEMFQMVIDDQEELELLVQEMKDQLDNSNAFIISYGEGVEYAGNEFQCNLFDEYPIIEVTAKRRNGEFKLTVHCAFCPNPYTYWGVYYTENGEPSSWGGELEEVEGMLTEIGSFYKYETENIVENWYYWQCMTR